jgi:hypothetical protein
MVTKRLVLLAKGTPPLVLRSTGGAGDLLEAEAAAGDLADEAAVAFRSVLPLVEVLRLLLFTSVDWLICWSARGGRTGAAARELALLLDRVTEGTVFTGSPVDLTLLLPLERRRTPGVELVDGEAVQDR